jgi:hypothetical protein
MTKKKIDNSIFQVPFCPEKKGTKLHYLEEEGNGFQKL